jgi:hypothetical protein
VESGANVVIGVSGEEGADVVHAVHDVVGPYRRCRRGGECCPPADRPVVGVARDTVRSETEHDVGTGFIDQVDDTACAQPVRDPVTATAWVAGHDGPGGAEVGLVVWMRPDRQQRRAGEVCGERIVVPGSRVDDA